MLPRGEQGAGQLLCVDFCCIACLVLTNLHLNAEIGLNSLAVPPNAGPKAGREHKLRVTLAIMYPTWAVVQEYFEASALLSRKLPNAFITTLPLAAGTAALLVC